MAPKLTASYDAPEGGAVHLDSVSSIFLQRETQQIQVELEETPFGPLKSEQLIPIVWDMHPGAEEFVYDRVTRHGMASWLAAGADDIPRAAVERRRQRLPIKSAWIGYGWTEEEIRTAAYANRPLEREEAEAARFGMDAFRDKTLLTGDSSVDYPAFANDSSVPAGSVTNGTWETATGDEILQDVNDLFLDILATVKEVPFYTPDTLVVPLSCWGRITSTYRGANTDTTIEEAIRKTRPEIKQVIPWAGLETLGAGSTKRMVLYRRDPKVVLAHGSIMFQPKPPQQNGRKVFVPCEGRWGPTHWKVPIAAKYGDGI